MKRLDFIVIGAQKCGTTSMFNYLRHHPQLFLPMEKELRYFTPRDAYERGWREFALKHFEDVPPGVQWGTVTPQYMMDPAVPERMAREMPNLRLIAMLRNPIDRAVSHYRMNVRRGQEYKSMPEAFARLLSADDAEQARQHTSDFGDERHGYLIWSEYGRILQSFFDHFPREQIKVVYLEDMAADPAGTVAEVLRFLKADTSFVPPNIDQKFLQAKPTGWRDTAQRWSDNRLVRKAWRTLPAALRMRLIFALDIRPLESASVAAVTREQIGQVRPLLQTYFASDVRGLEAMLGEAPPWPEFCDAAMAPSTPVGATALAKPVDVELQPSNVLPGLAS